MKKGDQYEHFELATGIIPADGEAKIVLSDGSEISLEKNLKLTTIVQEIN